MLRFREDVESAAAAVIKQQQQLEQQQLQQQQKKRYKLHLWKHGPTLQITMDRLLLLALFDRDSSIYEVWHTYILQKTRFAPLLTDIQSLTI